MGVRRAADIGMALHPSFKGVGLCLSYGSQRVHVIQLFAWPLTAIFGELEISDTAAFKEAYSQLCGSQRRPCLAAAAVLKQSHRAVISPSFDLAMATSKVASLANRNACWQRCGGGFQNRVHLHRMMRQGGHKGNSESAHWKLQGP